ncbi:hypothetical protein TIFTF001_023736 [Ficus carica]|uniref:Uncharacterized protein n=1 Tax=Ficus carica TaxID=3494 RepID=A0AA88DGF5_FICCA|nr:hypothetical protein TIFTF001_023736 [Ficus carica]
MNEFGSAPHHEEDAQVTANEQRNDDDMIAMAVIAVTNSRRNRRRVPQPMPNSSLTGSMRVEEILNCHEDIIQGLISMKSETFRVLSNLLGGHVDVNVDYVFDDGIDGTGPSTGTQQHDSSRGGMNQMRDVIADDMWERYQSSPWYKSA